MSLVAYASSEESETELEDKTFNSNRAESVAAKVNNTRTDYFERKEDKPTFFQNEEEQKKELRVSGAQGTPDIKGDERETKPRLKLPASNGTTASDSVRRILGTLPEPKNSGKRKGKGVVKIGLPSFTEVDSDSDEDNTVPVQKASGSGKTGSGLMTLLPKPKYSISFGGANKNTPFEEVNNRKLLPYTLSKKQRENKESTSTENLSNKHSLDDDSDLGKKNDFFSLETTNSEGIKIKTNIEPMKVKNGASSSDLDQAPLCSYPYKDTNTVDSSKGQPTTKHLDIKSGNERLGPYVPKGLRKDESSPSIKSRHAKTKETKPVHDSDHQWTGKRKEMNSLSSGLGIVEQYKSDSSFESTVTAPYENSVTRPYDVSHSEPHPSYNLADPYYSQDQTTIPLNVEGHSGYHSYEANMYSSGSYASPQTEIQLDHDAILKLQGKRKLPKDQLTIVDVHGEQLEGSTNELLKQLTEENEHQPKRSKAEMPKSQERRKHQITYLAFQAKERELELKNTWAANSQTKRQTQGKYGF